MASYYNTHLRKTSDPTAISKTKMERGMVIKIKYKKQKETKLYLVFVLQPKWPNTTEGKLNPEAVVICFLSIFHILFF